MDWLSRLHDPTAVELPHIVAGLAALISEHPDHRNSFTITHLGSKISVALELAVRQHVKAGWIPVLRAILSRA